MPKLETGVRLNGVRKLANASKSCSTQVSERCAVGKGELKFVANDS